MKYWPQCTLRTVARGLCVDVSLKSNVLICVLVLRGKYDFGLLSCQWLFFCFYVVVEGLVYLSIH